MLYCSSIELAPRSDKYNVRPAVTPAAGTRPSTQATRASTASSEAQWLAAQTKRPAPPPPRIPTPIVEHWPDSAVARYCRDVGKMSLEEFQWCLDKNHWDAELQHIPFGAPEPPLIDPVWWWPGWGSRWGKLAKPRNPYGYVHNWFVRGKVRAREEFKPYFGTYESEMAREFAASIETIPLVVAVRRDEGTLRSEVAEAAALEPTFVPPEAPPAALSRGASLSRTSLSLHNKK